MEPHPIRQGIIIVVLALSVSCLMVFIINKAFFSPLKKEQKQEQEQKQKQEENQSIPKKTLLITSDRWGYDEVMFEKHYSDFIKVTCFKGNEKSEFDANSPDWKTWCERRLWLINDIRNRTKNAK